MGIGRSGDFFMRQKRHNRNHGLLVFTGGGDGFGTRKGNGAQQELGEVAEGSGFLARDAALREQAKHLGESAVHAGGGGEVAAGGVEFGKVEGGADDLTSGCRVAEQLVFSFGVKATQRGMNVGAGHGALASVGEHELAALRQWGGVDFRGGKIVVSIGIRLRSVAWWGNMVGVCGESFRRGCR